MLACFLLPSPAWNTRESPLPGWGYWEQHPLRAATPLRVLEPAQLLHCLHVPAAAGWLQGTGPPAATGLSHHSASDCLPWITPCWTSQRQAGSAFAKLCLMLRGPLGLALLPGVGAVLRLCVFLPTQPHTHCPPALRQHPPAGSCSSLWVLPGLTLPVCVCPATPSASALLPGAAPRLPVPRPTHPGGSLLLLPLQLSLPLLNFPPLAVLSLCFLFFPFPPSCCLGAQMCSASSPFARLFVLLSLPPPHSTSDTVGLFFFFPLSCSFWLPRPLISFGVGEERCEEEEGGGEAAFPKAFVRAKWSGRVAALQRRRAARCRGRSRGIAVSGLPSSGRELAFPGVLALAPGWRRDTFLFLFLFVAAVTSRRGMRAAFPGQGHREGASTARGALLSPHGRGDGLGAAWAAGWSLALRCSGTAGDAAAPRAVPQGASRERSRAADSSDVAEGRAVMQPRAPGLLPRHTPPGWENPTHAGLRAHSLRSSCHPHSPVTAPHAHP